MSNPQSAPLSYAQKALLEQASSWSKQNLPERAADCWRRVLEQSPDVAPALNGLGSYYLSRGELDEAQRLLQRAAMVSDQPALAYANLSRVYSARGNLTQALDVIKQAIQAEPTAWGAHVEKARLLQQLGRDREASSAWSAAMAYMPSAIAQASHMQALVNEARAAIAANQVQLREHLLDHMHGALEGGSRRQLERFDHCLDILTGRRTFVTARPLMLPFPRLPAIPFFHREDYDWVPRLEDAFSDILGELEELLAQQSTFQPYVQTPPGEPMGQFAALDRKLDWGAYFLWRNGQRIDQQADLCPRTETALFTHAPLNRVPNRAPVAFFSALKPGTHIPPHNGATNTRLTVHLPLIIPPDCALRVGGETHVWKPGELVLFDDTIQHEAWNFSDRLRVVLIFDIWHPMLTDLEKHLVAHTVEGIMTYYGEGADLGEL
ncbi:MAG TPA: aspartyl/asparaginyl beta-hydroxylase domain-containing protein [Acidovorax sp.]|nr:aspartyl/asparaginyl beta-hydroxylase domain-containing protein [Acidovorax sp.]